MDEEEEGISPNQEVDFCTLAMFIIGKSNTYSLVKLSGSFVQPFPPKHAADKYLLGVNDSGMPYSNNLFFSEWKQSSRYGKKSGQNRGWRWKNDISFGLQMFCAIQRIRSDSLCIVLGSSHSGGQRCVNRFVWLCEPTSDVIVIRTWMSTQLSIIGGLGALKEWFLDCGIAGLIVNKLFENLSKPSGAYRNYYLSNLGHFFELKP